MKPSSQQPPPQNRHKKTNSKSPHPQHSKSPNPNSDVLLNKRIVSPQKLKILVLSGNQLQNNELQFLSKCINLIKLDLSHNHITKLSQKFGIKNISNLRVLNLQSNKLSTIDSLQAIFFMESLQVFSYKDNLLEQHPKAEHLVINSFPSLKILNYRIIFVEQRDPNFLIDRKSKYIAMDFEEWQPAQHSQKYYLRVLKLQLQYIDNMWMFHNPIVKIQRIWRAILQERQDQELDQQTQGQLTMTIHKTQRGPSRASQAKTPFTQPQPTQKQKALLILKAAFSQWKSQTSSVKSVRQELQQTHYYNPTTGQQVQLQNMQHLVEQLHQYLLIDRNLKIRDRYQRFLKKCRLNIYLKKMVEIFKRNIKIKVNNFADPLTSFYTLSGLSESKRIYFSRVQQHLIENFLAHIAKNYNKHSSIYTQGKFGIGTQYVAVRMMDPDTYASKAENTVLTYLMWPSMKAVILKKKKFPFKQKSSLIKIKALSYIRNRDKKLTSQQIKKSNKVYTRLQKFLQHEYNEGLGYFECPDEFVLSHLLRYVFYHNRKAVTFPKIIERSQMMSLLQNYHESVALYTQKLLQRTTSAVKIQQQWRKYINNKRQKQSIYDKLKKNRACRLIQRFLRDRIWTHRLSFQRNLSLELSKFDNEKDVMVHEQLYRQLIEVMDESQKQIQLYRGLKIDIKDTVRIYHEEFPQKDIFFPELRRIHFSPSTYTTLTQPPSYSSQSRIDIYQFFHQNANVKIIECQGQKFYQFLYTTVQEAKLRVALFGLLTYRIKGSQWLKLLSKTTLSLYNQRAKEYRLYGIDCKQFSIKGNELQQQTLSQLKINLVKQITLQHTTPFIYLDTSYSTLFPGNQFITQPLAIEFYQKRFQDFPQKYTSQLSVVFHQSTITIKQRQIEERFAAIHKMLIKESQLHNYDDDSQKIMTRTNLIFNRDSFMQSNSKKLKLNIINPINEATGEQANSKSKIKRWEQNIRSDSAIESDSKFFNTINKKNSDNFNPTIQKTSQKRLSLYEIDNSLITPPYDPMSQTSKNYRTILEATESQKRQKITSYLEQQKQKRLSIKEKQKQDISQVRQKRRQEKIMNLTLKSFNENERTEQLKKKAQKVKQYKRRSLSNSINNAGNQTDFLQQGNFIMQQQLKMNLMRNRIKQVQKLKTKRKSLPRSLMNTSELRQTSQQSKSIKSNHSIRQKRLLFEGKDLDLHQLQKNMPSAALKQHSEDVFGGQTEVINKRTYVKKKSTKVGAYVRDPSLVHGVFPEEYYPIQSGKSGIMFPRVG